MKTSKKQGHGNWLVKVILEELALAEVALLREQQQQQEPAPVPEEPNTVAAPAPPTSPEAPGPDGADMGAGMPDMGSDTAGGGMAAGGDVPSGGGGMPGMEDAAEPGMEGMDSLPEEEPEEQTIEDFIKDLSSKTVVDIKKTLLADLQTGDKREQAEELMAQVEFGDEEGLEPTPDNVKQAVEYIRRTFNFKVAPKPNLETGAVE